MKVEFLLINFHDNDFYIPMCKVAEFLLKESDDEKSFPSTHLENYKNVVPKLMAIFQYMNPYHAGCNVSELQHYEKYFSEHTEYIVGIDEIKKHIEKYNLISGSITTELSGVYDDDLLKSDPRGWLYRLKLNLNSEAILLLFTCSENENAFNYIVI